MERLPTRRVPSSASGRLARLISGFRHSRCVSRIVKDDQPDRRRSVGGRIRSRQPNSSAAAKASRLFSTTAERRAARDARSRRAPAERIGRDQALIATIASTSTATPSGSTGTPTALRAWRPASPNTSCINSLAPLATLGWSVKSPAELTNTPSLTIRSTRSSEPSALLHLGEQHDSAAPRRGLSVLEV